MHKVSQVIMCVMLALGAAPWAVASPVPPSDSHGGAYLGVTVDHLSPEAASTLHLKNGGASIAYVDQDGPACHAGLKSGDIVTAFNGKPVSGPDQFASLIHASTPGSTVIMTVLRNGKSQDMKVTLGDWKQMAGAPPAPLAPHIALNPVGSMAFAPPAPPAPPEFDIPSYASISARHGIVVEPLSPQLGEFFGVPASKGVLVRSVEKGSPGAAAGLKAGDVIVRVNDETIHDMADWKRALKGHGGKVTLAIVRDKREQTVQMSLPANTSELKGEDWDAFEIDSATLAQLNSEEFDEIHRQADSAAKTVTPEMKKQAEEMRKQAAAMHKQAEQIRKDMEKMTPEMARTAREMADTMKPTAKELSDMARDMAQQWKDMQPEFQKDMEQFKKELEQEKREWQEIFKGSGSKQKL